MAQLGARFHGMEEVIGSIPIRSTKTSSLESETYRADPSDKRVWKSVVRERCLQMPFGIFRIVNRLLFRSLRQA